MSLITPTTKEVNDVLIAQLEAALNQTIPLLSKAFNRVLAKTIAGVFILLYKYGGFIFLQMFVSTASAKETEINGILVTPLIAWGELIGVGRPVAATNAELIVDINVEIQSGTLLSGTQLVNADNGVTYITIGDVLLNAATVQATIRAVSDQNDGGGKGAIGNLEVGAIVSFANPLANVSRNTTVASQTVTGANAEETEVYRQRVIDRFQQRPQGGALADYRQWSEEVAGILNAYPYTSDCPGQVDVYIEATEASSGSPDGIPTTIQLQEVLDNINLNQSGLATRRPANALANTFAITRTPFDTEVTGLVVDNPSQVQINITSAIEEYFIGKEPFITGLSINPRTDRITAAAIGGVVEDVVNAAGGVFSVIILTQSNVIIQFYSLGIGEKAKSDIVTFT